MPDLSIVSLTEEDELFCQYGADRPQPCVLSLDLRSGVLTAQYNPAVSGGNAVPMSVFHGCTRWFPIPVLTTAAANQLLLEVTPLAVRILAGAVVDWVGGNYIGSLHGDAVTASEEMHDRCDPDNGSWDDADMISPWPAADWFANEGPDAALARLGIDADTTDEEIDELAAAEEQDALTAGAGRVKLRDTAAWLRRRRDELATA